MECSARHCSKVASASTPYEDSGTATLAPLFLLHGSHTVSCAGSAWIGSWYPERVLDLLRAIGVVCIKIIYSRCLVCGGGANIGRNSWMNSDGGNWLF
jgi:hypothetical protein